MKKTILSLSVTVLTLGAFLLNSQVVSAASTNVTEAGSAQVPVTVTVSSDFTVGIPTSIVMASDGTGSYQISVKGDIDPNYTLNVVPRDDIDTADGINFNLTRQGVLTGDSIRVDVTDPKTQFAYNDINPDTDTNVECSLSAQNGTIPVGTWQGVLTYDISLTPINTTP